MLYDMHDTLKELIIYRRILDNNLIKKLLALTYENCEEKRADLAFCFIQEAETLGLEGNIVQSYMLHLISHDNNVFSAQAEKTGSVGTSLYSAAVHDIKLLQNFLQSAGTLLNDPMLENYIPTTPSSHPAQAMLRDVFLSSQPCLTPAQIADRLIEHYSRYGYGKLADFTAFRWSAGQGLTGIHHFEQITLDDIVGYEKQKRILLANTEAFIGKRPCNNVLLTGARGTGKSSCVKALANHFCQGGLRLVEVAKQDQKDLYDLLHTLRGYGKRFIVFLDDLSFEEHESDYKQLKSILEGGVEAKPDNVLIYATSNRQHIIRETWKDRGEDVEDLHRFDTVNEKLSLADRFGLTVTFLPPNQEEYFKIIEELARRNKLKLPQAQLQAEALKWEMTHSGRSGRAAHQLITQMLSSPETV